MAEVVWNSTAAGCWNANWKQARRMRGRLKKAGVLSADELITKVVDGLEQIGEQATASSDELHQRSERLRTFITLSRSN